jgi:hypothetical protein
MKFQVTFKSPDSVSDAIDDVIEASPETSREDLKKFVEPWIEWGEYVTIEFDTDEGTAVVKMR